MDDSSEVAEAQALRLGSVYEQSAALLRQPGVVKLLKQPGAESDWSAMQILGHMAEMIPYWLANCRMLAATSIEVPRFGRSQDAPERLGGIERGAAGDPDQVMQLLQTEIVAAMHAIRGMSPAQRRKKGIHIRRGEMTVADVIEVFIVAHAEEHIEQLRAALGA